MKLKLYNVRFNFIDPDKFQLQLSFETDEKNKAGSIQSTSESTIAIGDTKEVIAHKLLKLVREIEES